MKRNLFVLLLALVLVGCSGKEEQRQGNGVMEASGLSEYEQKEAAGSSEEFVQQLKHDGALEAAVDSNGYVVYTVDSHIDQIREGDGERLAKHTMEKAKAQGIEIKGCKVYDQATDTELATAE